MQYDEYLRKAEGASAAVEKQDFDKAIALLNELVQSDLPDLDKSVMSMNIGIVWDKKQNSIEALRWYDRGIRYEKPFQRFFVYEKKAEYLWHLGRKDEAADLYRDLLERPYLMLNDQERIRATLKQLQG